MENNNEFDDIAKIFATRDKNRSEVKSVKGEESPITPVKIPTYGNNSYDTAKKNSVSSSKNSAKSSHAKKISKGAKALMIAAVVTASITVMGMIANSSKSYNEASESISAPIIEAIAEYDSSDKTILDTALDKMYNECLTVEEKDGHRDGYIIWLARNSASDEMKDVITKEALEHFGYGSLDDMVGKCGFYSTYGNGEIGQTTTGDWMAICSRWHESEVEAKKDVMKSEKGATL